MGSGPRPGHRSVETGEWCTGTWPGMGYGGKAVFLRNVQNTRPEGGSGAVNQSTYSMSFKLD